MCNFKPDIRIICQSFLFATQAHEKLLALGERLNEYNVDTEHVDLCRCLVKLHFQLLILLESFEKLLRLISQCQYEDTSRAKLAEVDRTISADFMS